MKAGNPGFCQSSYVVWRALGNEGDREKQMAAATQARSTKRAFVTF